jgi:hypothetical protein
MSSSIQVEPAFSVLLGLVFGAIGGFLNSIVGWLSGDEAFNTRKNVKSIIVGIMAGMGIAFGSFAALGEAQSPQALLGILVLILLSAAGVQQLAHNAIAAATKAEPTPLVTKPAATTAAAPAPSTATATIAADDDDNEPETTTTTATATVTSSPPPKPDSEEEKPPIT